MEGIMRTSSESIAQLAAAMAKAQSELTNPAKSLIAVLERGRNGGGPFSYRYAPLSAGLDILRKALGKYELAVIQTTHIDNDRGLVLLTTTIAHGSGEWISALWPVCHVADIGHPKLMGAALTYARRYCLFTMVGLAGEDDLDAPEMGGPKEESSSESTVDLSPLEHIGVPEEAEPKVDSQVASATDSNTVEPIEMPQVPSPEPALARNRAAPSGKRKYTRRTTALSSPLPGSRDPVRSLAQIQDADALFRWAVNILPVRNKLNDAQRAEFDAAFVAKADAVGADPEFLLAFRPTSGLAEAENPPPSSPP
jgi:hypothetical protein